MLGRQPEDDVGQLVADREPLPLRTVLPVDADILFSLMVKNQPGSLSARCMSILSTAPTRST